MVGSVRVDEKTVIFNTLRNSTLCTLEYGKHLSKVLDLYLNFIIPDFLRQMQFPVLFGGQPFLKQFLEGCCCNRCPILEFADSKLFDVEKLETVDELLHDHDLDLTIIFEYFECHMECLVTQCVYLGNDEFAGR